MNCSSNFTGPINVQFLADGTFDPLNLGMIFQWNFGDGTTSTLANPLKAYTTSGPFTATLTVTNSAFLNKSESITIQVSHFYFLTPEFLRQIMPNPLFE